VRTTERVHTVIIGGGQAGLSVGYHLARRGETFLILDANRRIGDSWRKRWDSLRLFTPARFDSLDGMPFPGDPNAFPTKDEMANYLESYAAHFALPVRSGVSVDRVSKQDGKFVVTAGSTRIECDNVVVAMSVYQQHGLPPFAEQLPTEIVQLRSDEYKNPKQLNAGDVLLVGAGNSGSEIALDVARAGHRVWMSGRDTGHIPFGLGSAIGRLFLTRLLLRVVFHRVLTMNTPLGRKARPSVISHGAPLIRVRPETLKAAGVERVAKTVGVKDGLPLLEDGRVLPVSNVIWCNGYHPGFSWIDLPVLETNGRPRQDRGVVADVPGLYFVGLHFLYAMSSGMIHGVGRDADHVAEQIAVRRGEGLVNELQPKAPIRKAG